MPTAVLLTALPVEYIAVREHLTEIKEKLLPQGTVYETGLFKTNTKCWTVNIAQIGKGNSNAAAETERAISHFCPNIILFVGIAGRIKDIDIGDVVAATKVYDYESGKQGEKFQARPQGHEAKYMLVQRSLKIARENVWQKRIIGNKNKKVPKAYVEPIVTGEKVITSSNSEIIQFIRDTYNDAIAIEMEGFGFLAAVYSNSNTDAIVIRGISDRLDNKKESDDSGSQEIASKHASAFAFELLATIEGYEESDKSKEKSESRNENIFININAANFTQILSGKEEILKNIEKFVQKDRPSAEIDLTKITIQYNIPELVNCLSLRKVVVNEFLNAINKGANWIAIHGIIGSGKTQLGILLLKSLGNTKAWIRLRDLNSIESVDRIDRVFLELTNILPNSNKCEWYNNIFKNIPSKSVVVFDDLPEIIEGDQLYEQLLMIGKFAIMYKVIIITIAHKNLHYKINEVLQSGTIYEKECPRLTDDEIKEILVAYGAEGVILDKKYVNFINTISNGHPVLINAIARFLKDKGWNISYDDLINLIGGQYVSGIGNQIIARILNGIEDEKSRELLYRLNLIIGAFRQDEISSLASIKPIIERPFERIHSLNGLWIQQESSGSYLISPLIKAIGSKNLDQDTQRKCHITLATLLLKKAPLNAFSVIEVFMHFSMASLFRNAALLLSEALRALNFDTQEKVNDYGILAIWASPATPLPNELELGLKIHIRTLQFITFKKYGLDTAFVLRELDAYVELASDNEALFLVSIVVLANPILEENDTKRKMRYTKKAAQYAHSIKKLIENEIAINYGQLIELLVWPNILSINSDEDLNEWLETVEILNEEQKQYVFNGQFSEEGSIYLTERLWLVEASKITIDQNWNNVLKTLMKLKEVSRRYEANILWACTIRAEITVLADFMNNIELAEKVANDNLISGIKDLSIYFLIYECLGRQYKYKKDNKKALHYLKRAIEIKTDSFPLNRMLAILEYSSIIGDKNQGEAIGYGKEAVEIAETSKTMPILDKVKALGELSIAYWLNNNIIDSFHAIEKAAKDLYAIKSELLIWKDIFMVLGNTLVYLASISSTGKPPQIMINNEPFAKPFRGIFLTHSDARSKLYKKENESGVYVQLSIFANSLGFYEKADNWIKKGLEKAILDNQYLVVSFLSTEIIPSLIFKKCFAEVIEYSFESNKILVAHSICRKGKAEFPKNKYEITSLLERDKNNNLKNVESYTFLYGVIPIIFYIANTYLKDTIEAKIMANSFKSFCVERSKKAIDSKYWMGAAELLNMFYKNDFKINEMIEKCNNYSKEGYSYLHIIGYIIASLSDKITPIGALKLHLSFLPSLFVSFEPHRSIYNRVILVFLENYWTTIFKKAKFYFGLPAIIENDLNRIKEFSENKRAQYLLKTIAEGLSEKLSIDAKKWIEE